MKSAVLATVLFFIGRYVWWQWQAVEQANGPNLGWLCGASIVGLVAMLITLAGYRALIQGHDVRIAYSKTLALWSLPLLGKYIPGKIWTIAAAIHMFHNEGISRKTAAASVTLFMALGVAASILVSLAFGGTVYGGSMAIGGMALLVPILGIVLWPGGFYRMLELSLRLFGREASAKRLSAATLLRVLAIFFLANALFGVAFCLLATSIAPVGLSEWPKLIAMFTFAQVAGFLALFAPAGIGVREGVLLAGLGPVVGPGPAIVIAGVCRLWQTAMELLMAAIGWGVLRNNKPQSAAIQNGSIKSSLDSDPSVTSVRIVSSGNGNGDRSVSHAQSYMASDDASPASQEDSWDLHL